VRYVLHSPQSVWHLLLSSPEQVEEARYNRKR
jgi:hypothetical protein